MMINETRLNDVAPNTSEEAASIDLVQLLTTYLPREKLRGVVRNHVRSALVRHLGDVAEHSADAVLSSADHLDNLREAAAIALPPALCTLMARVGFDKSLFTYGHVDGVASGFAEGVWLLKFVGLADSANASRHAGRPLACRAG